MAGVGLEHDAADCSGGLDPAAFLGHSNPEYPFLEGQEPSLQPREPLLLWSGPLAAAGHSHVSTYKLYSSHVGKVYGGQMPNAWCLCVCPDGWVVTSETALMLWLWGCQHGICPVHPYWEESQTQRPCPVRGAKTGQGKKAKFILLQNCLRKSNLV